MHGHASSSLGMGTGLRELFEAQDRSNQRLLDADGCVDLLCDFIAAQTSSCPPREVVSEAVQRQLQHTQHCFLELLQCAAPLYQTDGPLSAALPADVREALSVEMATEEQLQTAAGVPKLQSN